VKGLRIAILGLGRSGLSVGQAAIRNGAFPTVFDEKTLKDIPKPELVNEAETLGLQLRLGWDRRLGSGFDLLVANPAVPKNHPTLVDAVKDGVEVISEIEFAYRIAKVPIVAITGTNGKSTTTVMTYLCLQECGIESVLCGNIFGSGYPELTLTEASDRASAGQVLVAEVSSFQLEWVRDFRPVAAGITNVQPDHLDRYSGGLDEYAATKRGIFSAQQTGDTAVCPKGDSLAFVEEAIGSTVKTFGTEGADAFVADGRLHLAGRSTNVEALPFSEPHNLRNAAMAGLLALGALDSASARFEGYGRSSKGSADSIFEGLRKFKGLAHRMERVGVRQGVQVINNSMCTNPDALVNSALAISTPIHLIVGGVNKDLNFRGVPQAMGTKRFAFYLFGKDAEEINGMLGNRYSVFRTMEAAFGAATKVAKDGETIMLAPGCASTDQFRDFRERGDVFRSIAKEWLTGESEPRT
jgi:UDP-N-acetylmuramoylalanine--D-glutamate ligase